MFLSRAAHGRSEPKPEPPASKRLRQAHWYDQPQNEFATETPQTQRRKDREIETHYRANPPSLRLHFSLSLWLCGKAVAFHNEGSLDVEALRSTSTFGNSGVKSSPGLMNWSRSNLYCLS
jgi:hypothetical protein